MGAPEVYSAWRNGQEMAMERLLGSKKKFIVLALPTGVGKSLVAMTHAIFSGKRTAYLTSTKGLQDQVLQDFQSAGLVDIRGMSNYDCRLLGDERRPSHCANGPCLDGEKCRYRDRGCDYFEAMATAKASKLVVTNYAKWLTARASEDGGLGKFDLVICDEAHETAAEVSGFLRAEFSGAEIGLPPDAEQWGLGEWRKWATVEGAKVEKLLERHGKGPRGRELRDLKDLLDRVAVCGDDWVADKTRKGWSLEPLWPGKYASMLWEGAEQVVFASATIRPRTMEQLGLKPADYEWIECPSPFAIGRRPILHVPSVKLSHRTDEGSLGIWLDRIDQIIEGRLDRKGIIHTVSYDRAKYLLRNSKWAAVMMSHESTSTRDVVAQFKAMPAPAVLVSPSLHTGWDFPADLARYQIIAKVPWPDSRSKIVQGRTETDSDYPAYEALTRIVQMAGRVVRGPEDWGETLIVDDQITWMLSKYRQHIPAWFREAYRSVAMVPQAPRPIGLAA